jgi:hypothetical protein
VQNEVHHVKVLLENFYPFEMAVDNIQLVAIHSRFESLPKNITLAPHSWVEFLLSGRFLDATSATLLGVRSTVFGITSFHPINEHGLGISL